MHPVVYSFIGSGLSERKKQFGFLMFSLLVSFSVLDARNLSYQLCFQMLLISVFAVAH